MKLEEFLARAWMGYAKLTPDAPVVHSLLEKRGEKIINDHVAFRTFNLPGISRLELGQIFEEWGYRVAPDELDFPEKKLKANYYLHPDPGKPKIFVSELLVEKCSSALQSWIRGFVNQRVRNKKATSADFFLEPTWDPVSLTEYNRFYTESEYAAWTAAFGIQVNHFTVLVNSLRTFGSLQELDEFLKGNGMTLNSAGGEIKGTPKELLEQSSTVAKRIPWRFADGVTESVMGCYYEFAKRYLIPGTKDFFQGFIPKSADKIFESTFEKR